MFPFLALPAYWIFGRSKFEGYICSRREEDLHLTHIVKKLSEYSEKFVSTLDNPEENLKVLEQLAKLPFTKHNHAELLVDGQATFDAIFEGIESARDYIIVQFFITHDDQIGRELQDRLLVITAGRSPRLFSVYRQWLLSTTGLPTSAPCRMPGPKSVRFARITDFARDFNSTFAIIARL